MIALDTETEPFSYETPIPRLVCVSVAGDSGEHLRHWTNAENFLDGTFASATIVGHNIAYDTAVIVRQFPALLPLVLQAYREDRITDTMLREKLIDIARGEHRQIKKYGKPRGYSLAACVKRHFDHDVTGKGTTQVSYGQLRDVPLAWWPPEARRYALDDAALTLRLARDQETASDWLRSTLVDQYRQARAAFWLHLAGARGMQVNQSAVDELENNWRKEYDELQSLLHANGLLKIVKSGKNRGQLGRDTKAIHALVTWCKPNVELTATGKPKTSKDILEDISDPRIQALTKSMSLQKRLGSDIPLLRRGTVRCRFDSLLESGRTSASPNVQNRPRKGGVRECHVPREGFAYVAGDYPSFELHTFAQMFYSAFCYSDLREALNRGDDCHLRVAANILERPYAWLLANREAPGVDDARQVGKVGNYGFLGGLGERTFVMYAKKSYGVIVTPELAHTARSAWFSTWSEMRDWFAWVDSWGDTLVQHRVGRIRGGGTFTQLANSAFQGFAADIAKDVGWRIFEACMTPGSALWGSSIVNFPHDEFILESPLDMVHDAATALERIMTDGANAWLPDCPVHVEAYAMSKWSKNARRVEREGRIVPWQP